MGTKKLGRPPKSKDVQLRHYVGIRYDDETREFIEEYRVGQKGRLSEAEVWRRAMDVLREKTPKGKS